MDEDEDLEENLNDANYDEFAGYDGAYSFIEDPYNEDEEADAVYEAIDEHTHEEKKRVLQRKKMEGRNC